MPGSNADVRSPCGFVRAAAEILPGDVTQSEHGTAVPPSMVPCRVDRILEAAQWRGLEEAPGPDTARGSNAWQGMRAPFEPDATRRSGDDRSR